MFATNMLWTKDALVGNVRDKLLFRDFWKSFLTHVRKGQRTFQVCPELHIFHEMISRVTK